jgi:hypothetical protein
MTALFLFLIALLFVSCIGGLITQQIFLSRLRRLHTVTWDQLGKPATGERFQG